MNDVCIILSINHLLLPQSYLLNGSLNNADCPDTGHVFMVMLVFRSDAMILNQPVDRWSKLHKQHPAARHYWDTCHYATMQTCRWCLTMFRAESATLIQGTYELLLFMHCTLKSVTSHKSKIKIHLHLQFFLDFNVEQCRVRLK